MNDGLLLCHEMLAFVNRLVQISFLLFPYQLRAQFTRICLSQGGVGDINMMNTCSAFVEAEQPSLGVPDASASIEISSQSYKKKARVWSRLCMQNPCSKCTLV